MGFGEELDGTGVWVLDRAADATVADFHPFGHFLPVLING